MSKPEAVPDPCGAPCADLTEAWCGSPKALSSPCWDTDPGHLDGCRLAGQTDRWMARWLDGRIEGGLAGWMDGWTDG